MAVSINCGSLLSVPLQEEPYYFGFALASDFWKLPYMNYCRESFPHFLL